LPHLARVNGIGTALVGGRDHDSETETYVKTLAFTVLFVPILALGAYRVADAQQGGWYFLGKVPLSGFARGCNALVLLLALAVGGWIGWDAYTDTPDYKAAQKLARAERLAAEGQGTQAATLYREVMTGTTPHAEEARERLTQLSAAPPGSA